VQHAEALGLGGQRPDQHGFGDGHAALAQQADQLGQRDRGTVQVSKQQRDALGQWLHGVSWMTSGWALGSGADDASTVGRAAGRDHGSAGR
jgi:hypothetical protein